MKEIFTIITLLLFVFTKSQQSKLQGSWILDKILYQNEISIEINNPLYSNFMKYVFIGNNLDINNQTFKVSIDNSTISTNFRKLDYKFDGEYLMINEIGDDKNFYFLKEDKYLQKYPEFEPRETIYKNKIVYESNTVVKPTFSYPENFEDYIRKNIPSYSSISATNNYFSVKYILTKDNKITDIHIVEEISKTFDNEFIVALMRSEKYLKNNFGKDLLVTQTFNFFKMFEGLTNKTEKQIFNISNKGDSYYEKNDFNNAILNYEKLFLLEINGETKHRFVYELDKSYVNLGISYLATGKNEKACVSFNKVGDKTNFKVRNYLLNFCK